MVRSAIAMSVFVLLLGCLALPALAQNPPSEPGEEPGGPEFAPQQPKTPPVPPPPDIKKSPYDGEESPGSSPIDPKPTGGVAPPPPPMTPDEENPPKKPAPGHAPAPGPTLAQIESQTAPPAGFMLKVTLPVASGTLAVNSSSQLALNALPAAFFGGMTSSGFGGGLGLQFNTLNVSSGYSDYSLTTVVFSPQFTFISPGAAGGKVRFTANGGPIFGMVDGISSSSETELIVGYNLGLGGMFFPHRSFGVGLEVGFVGQFWTDSDLSMNYIYGALTAAAFFGS